jgi:hypothetical protein
VAIDFENFISAIEDDGIARGRAAVARDEDAPLELESEDRGGLSLWNIRS